MFSIEEDARIASTRDEGPLFDHIEDVLGDLGRVRISDRGSIDIQLRDSFDNFFTQTSLHGRIRERRDGDYQIVLKVTTTLSAVGWVLLILGIMIALTGALLLLIPMQKKDEVARKVRRTLRDLEDEIG